MIVHFVGTGPGDPELLTLKAARLLSAYKICVYAGSLVSPGVLALIPAEAPVFGGKYGQAEKDPVS
jgi:precorrin-4/cobalt-precorrin-4 C11-methyltransferase